MKRFFAFFLALILVAALAAACGKKPDVLTAEDALEIALEQLDAEKSEVSDLHAHVITADGDPAFSISFAYEGEDYIYTIHANTGEILSVTKGQPHQH